ncbi:MAG: hypothetical protein R2748_13635 [Bryobacterales bacterium]
MAVLDGDVERREPVRGAWREGSVGWSSALTSAEVEQRARTTGMPLAGGEEERREAGGQRAWRTSTPYSASSSTTSQHVLRRRPT